MPRRIYAQANDRQRRAVFYRRTQGKRGIDFGRRRQNQRFGAALIRAMCAIKSSAIRARLLDTARALAHLDVYASLIRSRESSRDYVRPSQIEEEPILDIRSGRHPIVEAHTTEPFVPNDAVLDCESQQEIIITGPNASGKSHVFAASRANHLDGANRQFRARARSQNRFG